MTTHRPTFYALLERIPHKGMPICPFDKALHNEDGDCLRCAFETWEKRWLLMADAEIENALLKGVLKTVHLAGVFGRTNQEVANRLAELEYTHIQAGQYIANAQEREHEINQLREQLAAERERCAALCEKQPCRCLFTSQIHSDWCPHGLAAEIRGG